MGVEILGAELTQRKAEHGGHVNMENTKPNQGEEPEEPIKFGAVEGSNGMANGVSTGEQDPAADSIFPKDAVDEWPAPKQIHAFYFVRYRSYEDPKLKAKIDQADKDLQRKNQARVQLTEALRGKRSDRAAVISQLKTLTSEDKQYRTVLDEKRKELQPLTTALGKLRNASNAAREKGVGLCSSEEELNDLIASLHYRMQHESNTLVEEKQLLREIKQLEGTREKVIANAAMKAKIQDSLGHKDAIQDQVKLIGGDLDGVRKEQQTVRAKIKRLEEELKTIDNDIVSLQEEFAAVTQKREKAYETLHELRKERDEGNASFFLNRVLLNKAKELAAKKDIAALEELCHSEVDKFMSLWSSNKGFRDDYKKRILPSLDIRLLSRDGRMRNPDEKPLVSEVVPVSVEPVPSPVKTSTKQTKGDVNPSPDYNTVNINKARKEGSEKSSKVEKKVKGNISEDDEMLPLPKKPQNESAVNVVDKAKLKEMKREEEIAKAKLAMERKKKLAEKAAAKAAIRAQKEVEKKEKEREKRARKKAGSASPATDAEQVFEAETDEVDTEKTEPNVETAVPAKSGEQKENNVRLRNRSKALDTLPKIILQKKKSTPYWMWVLPASAVAFILVMAAYYVLLSR